MLRRVQLHGFLLFCFFFFKQKTAYEMRISDWSSDVCSSDLRQDAGDRYMNDVYAEWVASRAMELFIALPVLTGAAALFVVRAYVGGSTVKIGRGSCREGVCQAVYIWGVAGSFKK